MAPSPAARRGAVATTCALVLLGLAGPFAYAVAQPAYSTGDEMAHVDYAYQLWLGRFPEFFEGLRLQTDVGYRPGLQWVSQHPPLFYALLAPIVGPLVEAGHPVVAVMLARGALIIMAAASVLVVRWMVRGAFPARPEVATAAALLYGLSSWFPRQGGSIYNDLPATLAIAMAVGFLVRALRAPDNRRLLVGLATCLAVASLVRFSTLPLVAIIVGVLAVHRMVVLRRVGSALVQSALCVAAVVAASGWWWARNLSSTGNLQGSRADYWIEERGWVTRGFLESFLAPDFWQVMLQQFFSTTFLRPLEPWLIPGWLGVGLLFVLPLIWGTTSIARDFWRRRDGQGGCPTEALVVLTLLGLLATIVATQVYYRMSSGSALPRYFFALIPFAAALMSYGFMRSRWTRRLLGVWLVARLASLAVEVRSTLDRPLRGPQADTYPELAWLAFAVVALASLVVVWNVIRHPDETGRTNRTGPAAPPLPVAD